MFKKDMTKLTSKGQVFAHKGKGAVQEHLPSRDAMQTLTAGNVGNRTINDYAKAAPTAPDVDQSFPSIPGM